MKTVISQFVWGIILFAVISFNCCAEIDVPSVSTLSAKWQSGHKVDNDFASVKRLYTQEAAGYDENTEELDEAYPGQKTYDNIQIDVAMNVATGFEEQNIDDAIILDAGVGTGLCSVAMSRFAKEIVALDVTPAMLDQLDQKINRYGIENITTIEGSVTNLQEALKDVPHKHFNAIVCNYMIHHILTPQHNEKSNGLDPLLLKMLQGFYAVLIPGGRVYIVASSGERRNITQYARQAGFQIIDGPTVLRRMRGAMSVYAEKYIVLEKAAFANAQFYEAA